MEMTTEDIHQDLRKFDKLPLRDGGFDELQHFDHEDLQYPIHNLNPSY